MKDDLVGKNVTKFVGLKVKIYSYFIDYGSENKKPKSTKNCVIKRKLKFENYKNYLQANELENKINYLESNKTDIYTIKKVLNNS